MIDTHIHIYDPSWGDFDWPPKGSSFYRRFLCDDYKAEGTAFSPVVVGCSQEFELNDRIAAECDGNPLAACFVGQLDPRDPDCAVYAEKLSRHPSYRGFRAVNEHILAAPERFIEAARFGKVVEIQGNYRKSAELFDLIRKNPDISFIFEHFSGYLFDGKPMEPDYPAFLEGAAALPNTSMKVSGLFTLCRLNPKPLKSDPFREVFSAALKTFGADRCMYGSDWPVLGVPLSAAEDVTEAIVRDTFPECADDAVKAVMGGNAERIYKL